MRTALFALLLCLTGVVFSHPCVGQEQKPPPSVDPVVQLEILNKTIAEMKVVNELLNQKLERSPRAVTEQGSDYEQYWTTYQKKLMDSNLNVYNYRDKLNDQMLAYQKKIMEGNMSLFDWHNSATRNVHYLTMALVAAGLAVSIFQIGYGMVFGRDMEGAPKQLRETLEMSVTRIKIATTVSGLILLLITFAFFYIYVREVHPLKYPYSSVTSERPRAGISDVPAPSGEAKQ